MENKEIKLLAKSIDYLYQIEKEKNKKLDDVSKALNSLNETLRELKSSVKSFNTNNKA